MAQLLQRFRAALMVLTFGMTELIPATANPL
jgi:hypothetical protein